MGDINIRGGGSSPLNPQEPEMDIIKSVQPAPQQKSTSYSESYPAEKVNIPKVEITSIEALPPTTTQEG